jgi:hypothetical protein
VRDWQSERGNGGDPTLAAEAVPALLKEILTKMNSGEEGMRNRAALAERRARHCPTSGPRAPAALNCTPRS